MAETTPPPNATPDLSGMAQPGAAVGTPAPAAEVPANLAPNAAPQAGLDANQREQTADVTNIRNLQAESTAPAAPPKHAALLKMIEGLGVGLSAFGAAKGSGGKEGGAPMVQDYYAKQQQLAQSAQAARDAAKNQRIDQAIKTYDANRTLGETMRLNMSFPQEMEQRHLLQTGEQQRQAITGADFAASHGGMQPDEFTKAISATTPIGSQPSTASSFFTNGAQREIDNSKTILGNDAPSIQNLGVALADPKATAGQLWQAQQRVAADRQAKTSTAKERSELEASDPLFKLETDPNEMAGEKSTAALALVNSKLSSEKDPVQLARLGRLKTQADAAHTGFLADKQSEETAKQLAVQGKPEDAAKQLVDGTLTLADLKSRGLTPKFILDASAMAEKLAAAKGEKYNPSDEVVGESILKQAGSQAFFGSANSLLGPDGTLKQLEIAGKKIPQNQLPTANTAADWLKIKAGGGAPAGYAATLLGVADDYGKVMGGGSATDAARYTAEALAAMSGSPEQRAAAIAGITGSVESQLKARIAGNRYIQQREGYNLPKAGARPANVPTNFVHIQDPDGSTHWVPSLAQAQKVNPKAVLVP